MKCHYDILGIARDADDSDIKKAYRKLALQWHPDKNLDNQEKAREHFQLVQQAYEVLSDGHERAWYDNHRDQILRGRDSDYEDNCLDVFQYFTVTCFKGYNDNPDGFYAVYSEVFKKIAAEDAEFMDDEEDLEDIPMFGNSESGYEEVVGQFYAYWSSYCTKRTYSWLCKYNIVEIKDRRILREIEKETKKLAQKAKKERNEEVRNLVSFVKKRDKRVEAYRRQLEEKAELNRQKQEQNRLDQIRKRNKELEEMKKSNASNSFKLDGYEEQLRLLEQEYGSSSEEYTDDENDDYDEVDLEDINDVINSDEESNETEEENENDYIDELYCVACDKSFKNKKAVTNHQTSQKHLNNVEKLKAEMIKDNEKIKEESSLVEIVPEENNLKIDDNNGSVEAEDETIKSGKKNKKDKKSKKIGKNSSTILSSEPEDLPDLLTDLKVEKSNWNDDDNNKKSNKKGKNKKLRKMNESNNIENDLNLDDKNITSETNESSFSSAVKDTKKSEQIKTNETDLSHVCVTCKSVFPSKNKLFNHLKQTNHGVAISKIKESISNTSGVVNSKKNKRK